MAAKKNNKIIIIIVVLLLAAALIAVVFLGKKAEEPAPVSADKTLLTICKRGKKLWNI